MTLRRLFLAIAVLLLVAVVLPRLYPTTLRNAAQLCSIHEWTECAIALGQRALAANPTHESARTNLARAFLDAGDAEAALELLNSPTTSLKRTINRALAIEVLTTQGEPERARAIFDQLDEPVRLPDFVAAKLLLANPIDWRADDFDESDWRLLVNALGLHRVSSYRTGEVEADWLSEMSDYSPRRLIEKFPLIDSTVSWIASSAPAAPGPIPGGSAVDAQTDNELVDRLAEAVNIPDSSVQLSANQLRNGGFEQFDWEIDAPTDWSPLLVTGLNRYATDHPIADNAIFFVAPDMDTYAEGKQSLRLRGLAVERNEDRYPASDGVWHSPLELPPESYYLVTLAYRTDGLGDGDVEIWLQPDMAVRLPESQDQWSQVLLLMRTTSWNSTVRPLFRLFGAGDVWFDNVGLHIVEGNLPILETQSLPLLLVTPLETRQ